MEAARLNAVMLVASWASGISLYLTVLILGIGGRTGWIELPRGLEALEHPLVIGAAFMLYAVEFVADKVPYVDSLWDSVHTVVRPVGSIAVGFLAGTEYGPVAQALFALLAGTLTLETHTAKAAGRMAINTSPEPFSNVAMSLAEHAAVIAVFWLFAAHPFIACTVVAVFVIASFFVLRALWRFVRGIFGGKKRTAS